MLKSIHALPSTIEISRNGHELSAVKTLIKEINVQHGIVIIGDSEGIELFSPIKIMNGRYGLYNYEWRHSPGKTINVASILVNYDFSGGSFNEMSIDQDYAEHIDEGIPVDSASICFKFNDQKIDVVSGLGDGVYPLYGRKTLLKKINAIYIDYKIYHIRKVITFGDKELDKYSIVVNKRSSNE